MDLRSFYFVHLSTIGRDDLDNFLHLRGPVLRVKPPGNAEEMEFDFKLPARGNTPVTLIEQDLVYCGWTGAIPSTVTPEFENFARKFLNTTQRSRLKNRLQ